MANPLNPGIQKTAQVATKNLLTNLAERVLKTQIEAGLEASITAPSIDKVASTQALKELNDKIPTLTELIDDASNATDKVWSAEKVISYVAEKDDSEYFLNNEGLDNFTLSPERDGFVAIVYDASSDPEVGTDDNGDPLGGIYVREAGAWKLMKTIGYRAVSFVGYLQESDLVNDLATNDTTKPASAAALVAAKALIDALNVKATNITLLPQVMDISWDSDNSVNFVKPSFAPKGQPVEFKATVIDAEGVQTPYAAEFVDNNGTTELRILMETPADLSGNKVLFTYMHDGVTQA